MILYNLPVFARTQQQIFTPSWMRLDNFTDFVLPSRSASLYDRLSALLRRR